MVESYKRESPKIEILEIDSFTMRAICVPRSFNWMLKDWKIQITSQILKMSDLCKSFVFFLIATILPYVKSKNIRRSIYRYSQKIIKYTMRESWSYYRLSDKALDLLLQILFARVSSRLLLQSSSPSQTQLKGMHSFPLPVQEYSSPVQECTPEKNKFPI